MCIRDRPGGGGGGVGLDHAHDGQHAAAALAPALLRDHLPSCLLYTSDAADERSSVDLGGRRIIKKKNKG